MARNYAALPYEYGQEMVALSDAEFGRLCRALIEYSATGTPIALPGNERFYAARVMMQEDRFRTSYDALSEKRKEAGKKGGSKNKQTEANESKTPYTETETDTEVSSNEETNRRNARARFTPPSVQEVAEYCRERGNNVDAEQFVDFYASKGWKVGNATMKDWRAAVRTWEKRDKKTTDVKRMPSGKRDNLWMNEYD